MLQCMDLYFKCCVYQHKCFFCTPSAVSKDGCVLNVQYTSTFVRVCHQLIDGIQMDSKALFFPLNCSLNKGLQDAQAPRVQSCESVPPLDENK